MATSQDNSLARMKLRSLAGVQAFDVEPIEFGQAVGAVAGKTAFVLLTDNHQRGLGPALLWALRQSALSLKLFTLDHSETLIGCAKYFDFSIDVCNIGDRVCQTPSNPQHDISAEEKFVEFIVNAGAEVIREHGVLSGEVAGLEVCRVVFGEHNSDPQLEIGVGRHDRETFQLLHGAKPSVDALRVVVKDVAEKRGVGSAIHPLNQLARERLLRHQICLSPDLVGAKSLQPAPPPIPRTNLLQTVPCCASGVGANGQDVVVVFSVGVDPDLVTFGASARGQINPEAELIFALPPRDILPSLVQLGELLLIPARFCVVSVLDGSPRTTITKP